jgi:hypothetical protein
MAIATRDKRGTCNRTQGARVKILWLEDEAKTKRKEPHFLALARAHDVTIAPTVSDVMHRLKEETGWQVLLVDIQVPVGAELYRQYPGSGPFAGLYFLESQMDRLSELRCCPMIFTADPGLELQDLARRLRLETVPYISTYSIDDDPELLVRRIDVEFRRWSDCR